MHHSSCSLRALGAFVAAAVVSSSALAQAAPADAGTARVIVTYRAVPTASALQGRQMLARLEARLDGLARRHGLALQGRRAVGEHSQVVLAQGIDSAALARRLSADPDVAYAEPDRLVRRAAVPTDPLYATGGGAGPVVGQWYLKTPAGEVRSSIDATTAWDRTTGSSNVVVAVFDTGVRFDHPDLGRTTQGGKLLAGYDFVANTTYANDSDARDADASDPGDWVSQADFDSGAFGPNCEVADSSWHGTQVAGIVGALSNNAAGMAGVSWGARLLPLRVLGKCAGFQSDIVAAMRWAVGITVPGLPANPTPARVLNLSLGGTGSCGLTYQSAVNAVLAQGAVVVVSAGNSDGHAVGAPANCTGVIAVGGLRHIGTKVGYSDVGTEVAISAPGGNCVNPSGTCLYPILTATNTGAQGPVASAYTNGSNVSAGTSFSAPLVSGVAALMLSVQPQLTSAQILTLLQGGARPFPTAGADPGTPQCVAPITDASGNPVDQIECYCNTATCGAGMLDARAAVQSAASTVIAQIGVSSGSPQAMVPINLQASVSALVGGGTAAAYSWTITDTGGGIATAFTSSTNAATASVTASAAGTFSVAVTVTDQAGGQTTTSQRINVAAAPPSTGGGGSGGGGGGGGGALGWGYLVALLLAVVAARRVVR
ncbi:S8 family peptidase [uncultured Methylibium sp.]|uniref:S8 family peptidase n=1 Tax=uncultured Methylibium sp. TaxID=381093 RepID=UPI0025F33861|nr:S8 family peptidase [uncultured Methylibium sp.]